MTGSYYFWKWADNDFPGRPTEVLADLLRGEMHPALQTFDARPLLHKLESAASRGRKVGEEWDWEVPPGGAPERTRFVFVACPLVNKTKAWAMLYQREFFRLGLSGSDEQNGRIIPGLLPKLNVFTTGQLDEPNYDITPDDLPGLLRAIAPKEPDPFAILEDRRSRYVQCYAHGPRFCVEWRDNYDPGVWKKFDHWVAQDRTRLAALDGPYDRDIAEGKDPDLLRYADTLRIFQAFMLGEPRPEKYHWMNVTASFSKK